MLTTHLFHFFPEVGASLGTMPTIEYGPTAPPCPTSINAASSQAEGLISWWPLCPGHIADTDLEAADLVGNYSAPATTQLVAAGKTLIETEFGNSLDLNIDGIGVNDEYWYKNNLAAPYTLGQAKFSMSLWYYPKRFKQYGAHLWRWHDFPNSHNRTLMGVQPDQGGDPNHPLSRCIYYNVVHNNTSRYLVQNSNFKAAINAWNHIVITHNDVNEVYELYVNGTLVPFDPSISTDAGDLGGPTVDWNAFGLGGNGTQDGIGVTAGPQGSVFDYRLYNKILTQNEVSAIHNKLTRWELWGTGGGGHSWSLSEFRKRERQQLRRLMAIRADDEEVLALLAAILKKRR